MKILVVSQYFWPETFRINDLVEGLVRKGHEVEVLTAKPNYPQGKFYAGYSFFSKHHESYCGAKVHRVPLVPRGSASAVRLGLNYLSFVFFGSLFVLFKPKKYDYTFTFAISPITQILPALLHKLLRNSKSYLWVQDLWPESVSAASGLNNKFVIAVLGKLVKFIYKHADKVLIQSEFFEKSVLNYGCDAAKIEYLPNWAEDLYVEPMVDVNKYKHLMPDGFKVFFAGNIGESQDFESIVKAIKLVSQIENSIKFVIVGDGRKRTWLEQEIIKQHLQNTVFLLGKYPVEEMPHFFVHADLMLLTLKAEPVFSLTIPSKIQSYMAFGRPVVGMLDGIGASLIQKANCGYSCPAGRYNQLSTLILKMYQHEPSYRNEFAINATIYYKQNFAKAITLNKLDDLLK